jgi:hypothetical protein
MSQALVAITSLLLGVALNEWIRRSHRIENYAAATFQRRLEIYEQLWRKLREGSLVANKVIEDAMLPAHRREELISEVVLGIAQFCDDNGLYLNDEVTVHCCTVFMDVENIASEDDPQSRQKRVLRFADDYLKAREIVRAEAGLTRMDKLFRAVTKASYSSDVIEKYRELRKQREERLRE